GVGVERTLLRQSGAGPVLPPVEVPLEALGQGAPLAVEKAHPRTPRLLVGALQVAQVVDLEPRGAALVAGLEQDVRAAHLAELQRLVVARERRARRVVPQGIGPLVVVRRVALREGDRRVGSLDPTQVDRSRHLIAAAAEAVT